MDIIKQLILTPIIYNLYSNSFLQILIILLLSFFLYNFYKKYIKQHSNDIRDDLYKYKTNNFMLNKIYIFSYISMHTAIILFLRTKYLNKTINLYQQYVNILQLCTAPTYLNTLLLIIIILLAILIIIFIWVKINRFFITELIKGYIIFIVDRKTPSFARRWGLINKVTLDTLRFVLVEITMDVVRNILPSLYTESGYQFLKKFYNFLCYSFFSWFIIAFFFQQLWFNSFILTPIFNQTLLVYTIYTIYKRFCNFFKHTDPFVDEMLFNMYYKSYSIKYVNIPKEWEHAVYQYIHKGLYNDDESVYNLSSTDFAMLIAKKHTFRTSDGITYINSMGDSFIEDPNIDKDLL